MKKSAFILTVLFACFVVSGASLAGDSGTYKTALEKYRNGNYQEAVIFLKAHVEKVPDPAAYYLIGYALYKLKRFDEADQYFKDAYLVDPTFSPDNESLFKGFPKSELKKMKKASRHHKARKQRKTPQAAVKSGTSDPSSGASSMN